jgi:hypothetical protein
MSVHCPIESGPFCEPLTGHDDYTAYYQKDRWVVCGTFCPRFAVMIWAFLLHQYQFLFPQISSRGLSHAMSIIKNRLRRQFPTPPTFFFRAKAVIIEYVSL